MTKQQKIQYINKVKSFFDDARNHGNSNNWWYPKKNVIAYNVKLRSMSKNINDIREKLSKKQNEYMTDDALYNLIDDMQSDSANMLQQKIKDMFDIPNIVFAGRSGGWIEVEYNVSFDYVDDDTENADIQDAYRLAKELENLESDVSKEIERQHKAYCLYINTDDYITDIVDQIMSDEDIADYYKEKAKQFIDKI